MAEARNAGAELLLFGHTHHSLCQQLPDGLWMLNPGASRSSYGLVLLEGGANIRAVQDQLGHSKLATTQIYTHVDLEARKSNVVKLAY